MGFLKVVLGWLLAAVVKAVAFLVVLLLWAMVKFFLLISAAALLILNAIPVPEFMSALGVNLAAVPDGVWFFLAPLDFKTGISWVISAYLLRFLIRRIPVVG